MIRSCNFSIRLPLDLLASLERHVKEGKFSSVSEAIRSYIELGMHVESYKTMIKDPKFLKSIEDLKRTEGIFHWIETLTDEQVDSIATALKMEKENRYENIIKIIQNGCNKKKKQCKILNIVKCGQFSPRVNRICMDFKVK